LVLIESAGCVLKLGHKILHIVRAEIEVQVAFVRKIGIRVCADELKEDALGARVHVHRRERVPPL